MAENTVTTLSGLLKRVYSNKVEKVIPDQNIITGLVPFVPSSMKLGETLRVPVQLQLEQGITYAASGDGAFAFPTATPGSVKQAEVNAAQMLGVAELDFETASKAAKAPSQQAFERAMDSVVDSLIQSLRRRQEVNYLYGGEGLATIGSIASTTLTITDATWASYHWAGMVGAKVDIYNGGSATASGVTITAVNLAEKKITLSGVGTAAAGHKVFYAGAKTKESSGIYTILNTSGSLFGIDNSVYDLWKGNVHSVGGALTEAVLDDVVTMAMDKGFSGNMTVLVNPKVWSDLNQQQAAKRVFNDGNVDLKYGARGLVQHSQVGTLTIRAHTCVRQGDAFLLDASSWKRVGSVDAKLGDPVNEDEIITRLPTAAGYQMIAYGMNSMFCFRPGNNILLTGITT
jgi:hypothetical protein